jgi:hypothetical protein
VPNIIVRLMPHEKEYHTENRNQYARNREVGGRSFPFPFLTNVIQQAGKKD